MPVSSLTNFAQVSQRPSPIVDVLKDAGIDRLKTADAAFVQRQVDRARDAIVTALGSEHATQAMFVVFLA